jgi:serine/threonine protein kinase
MEFIDGKDLSDLIQTRGKVELSTALDFILQAAQALKAASLKSIIHRDIKPSNLMLTSEGVLKVSDLGLAKFLGETSDVTVTGFGMGSPYYIAPEQADGTGVIDHRADIYSLGITLLYLLTGKKPFEGNSALSIVVAQATKPLPSGIALGTELPPKVEALIQKMAAKKPEDRYQDYPGLIRDLEAVLRGEPIIAGLEGVSAAGNKSLVSRFVYLSFLALILISGGIYWVKFYSKTQVIDSNLFPTNRPATSVASREIQTLEPNRRDQPELRDQQPGNQGPGGRRNIPRLLGSLDRPQPLPDGPLEQTVTYLENYAEQNPTEYREIIGRYLELRGRAEGTSFEERVEKSVETWKAKRDAEFQKVLEEYKVKVNQLLATQGHREAMEHIRTFPKTLRSPETDSIIMRELSRPPPFSEGREDGPPPD